MPARDRETHGKVKRLFAEAVELPEADREAFLSRVCAGDAALREQVDLLLESHFPESIVGRRPASVTGSSTSTSLVSRYASRLLGHPSRRRWVVFLAGALLVGLGLWTHAQVRSALLDIRAQELRTVSTGSTEAMQRWIDDRTHVARVLADHPEVRATSRELARIAVRGSEAADALWASPARERFYRTVDPFADPQRDAGIILVSRDGTIIADRARSALGSSATGEAFDDAYRPVLSGQTTFTRPYRAADRMRLADTPYRPPSRPRSWSRAPVVGDDGEVLAVLVLFQHADQNFASILESGHFGATGETYAFDDDAVMISANRLVEETRRAGLLPDDPEATSMLTLELRDPGGDLARGHVPELDRAAQPLTRLAALAIADQRPDGPADHEGLLLTPYRNYLGTEVIGAWRWLPQYGFGIATELPVAEALAPLRYLELAMAVLFAPLVGAVGLVLLSSFSLLRLRHRVEELTELGPYRSLRPLGGGGMGRVFLAEHALLKRPTAVKTLRADTLTPDNVARFEREVRLASQLRHPNTIEIYDFGKTPDDVLYYAMEYVEGCTLAELVSRDGALPPARVIHLLSQVCGSLQEAHDHDLVHRDVKPQNIMVCERGGVYDVVKVLDFGLAKLLRPGDGGDVTREHVVGGTPAYMAPERLVDPAATDHRSDLYAVGAVAYHLLAARPLFPGGEVEILHHVISTEPEAISGLDPRIPTGLASLVMRCLDKDPTVRPQTAAELRAQLVSSAGGASWGQDEAREWWARHRVERDRSST